MRMNEMDSTALPYELIMQIFSEIGSSKEDIARARLLCRSWASVGAKCLFERMSISYLFEDIQNLARLVEDDKFLSLTQFTKYLDIFFQEGNPQAISNGDWEETFHSAVRKAFASTVISATFRQARRTLAYTPPLREHRPPLVSEVYQRLFDDTDGQSALPNVVQLRFRGYWSGRGRSLWNILCSAKRLRSIVFENTFYVNDLDVWEHRPYGSLPVPPVPTAVVALINEPTDDIMRVIIPRFASLNLCRLSLSFRPLLECNTISDVLGFMSTNLTHLSLSAYPNLANLSSHDDPEELLNLSGLVNLKVLALHDNGTFIYADINNVTFWDNTIRTLPHNHKIERLWFTFTRWEETDVQKLNDIFSRTVPFTAMRDVFLTGSQSCHLKRLSFHPHFNQALGTPPQGSLYILEQALRERVNDLFEEEIVQVEPYSEWIAELEQWTDIDS